MYLKEYIYLVAGIACGIVCIICTIKMIASFARAAKALKAYRAATSTHT